MRHDPPEHAIVAMAFLTALAVGIVWAVETLTKLFK
jgi:hypothetical protein